MGSLTNLAPPKYKRRRVSCKRDFPPGCGRNAPRINLKPRDSEVVPSLGDKENSMAGEKKVDVASGDCVKASENENDLLSHQVVKTAVRDFPPGCGPSAPCIKIQAGDSEAVASLGDKENSLADKKRVNATNGDGVKAFENGEESLSQQVVKSAVQDFPPECGKNARHITLKAVGTEAVASLGGKENLIADENKVNVAEGDCVKAIESGNESVSQQVVQSAVELEPPTTLDDLVGRVVAAIGVNVEFPSTVRPLGTGSPKVSELKESELPNELHDTDAPAESKTSLEIGSKADGMVPANRSKAWSPPEWPIRDSKMLKDPPLRSKLPRRRVSATRDFPPFCGRNALCPTEEERRWILLGNKTPCPPDKPAAGEIELLSGTVKPKEQGSPPRETSRPGMEELDADVGDGMKETLAELNSKADEEGKPSIEELRAVVEVSPLGEREVAVVEELKEDVRDGHAQKRKLEGRIPERKTKSQKVIGKDVTGVKGEVGKEIVVYQLGKSSTKKTPGGAAIALADDSDRVIVQGMMAAPNCPWRQGKGAADPSPDTAVTVSKKRRHANRSFTPEEKPKSAPKLKAKKKLLPSHKGAYKGKGQLVVKDLGDFAVQVRNESPSGGKRPHDFEVAVPPFGPNSSRLGDERIKVRETLRLFQAICRKLLQAEEAKLRQKGDPAKRIDLLAAQIVRDKGKEVNTAKFAIGSVPGVEVGDEFQYRVELALVGIHRLYQAGIDYTKHGKMIIATSIVASGVYADDLDNPDVLTYSGQGGIVTGKDKQPEDQKLERGNLALKNSITTRNPVRVVRGFKETKTSKADSKAKVVPTYTYDGLYTVEKYRHDVGPHGKLVFMFELRRIPGQPELAWKEVKKSNKFKAREGLRVNDISGGKEFFPICAVNTMDSELPPTFNYINEMKYPDWYCPTTPRGCDCIGGCSDSKKCSCVVKNGGEIPYNHNGAIVEAKPLVYECGPSCNCPPSCYNRVTQLGIQIQLEIFKTESRGWGVRSLTSIPSGSFICEYFGELIEDKEAEQRHNDEYLFDIGKNYSDCWAADGLSPEVVEEGCFTIDAAQFGNVGRFINHSCSPNLYAQNVLYDHEDKKMPHIMLFAAENIPPLQELTYHYNYSVDQVRDSSGNIKMKNCYCGSAECSGRMY